MNIPKREGKSSPMCGQPQVSACWWCIPVSHYSMRLCPESSMNFIISWLCEAAISGYPPCFGHAHISQDVILLFAYFTKIPDSRLHDNNVLYILLYYVFHKIPDSMTIILYIPSFVDHFSLFGWFNSLFVSTKILDLPEKNRKRSQRSWAHGRITVTRNIWMKLPLAPTTGLVFLNRLDTGGCWNP